LPWPRAHAANNSEQVVFSGVGFSPSTQNPVGFWIWCEADSSNPYQEECNGSMYFYALHITKHVEDAVPIAEPSEGQYLMSVQSSDGKVSCTLENDPPASHGPTNTVHISCAAPVSFTDGLSTNAVVNVTGPS
jgi:hypothetical protein